jgi:hypothetical protein
LAKLLADLLLQRENTLQEHEAAHVIAMPAHII